MFVMIHPNKREFFSMLLLKTKNDHDADFLSLVAL